MKWQRLKQNWLQGEEMPLVKKTAQKTRENGRIIPQNGDLGNQCTIPMKITEVTEIKSTDIGPKYQLLEDKSLPKNFWLT